MGFGDNGMVGMENLIDLFPFIFKKLKNSETFNYPMPR
jgi:hypothetical protein